MLLRFDITPQRLALASAAAMLSILGLAYWFNLLPSVWGYSKLGFFVPNDQDGSVVSATPIAPIGAISSANGGVSATTGNPNLVLQVPLANAQDVAPDGALSLQFDQPMDRSTVQSSLRIDPPVAGAFTWSDDNEVHLAPSAPGLLKGVTYTITLSNTARSLSGGLLGQPVSWSFHTHDTYLVSPGVTPGASLAPTSTLSIIFSEPMDAAAAKAVSLRADDSDSDLPVSSSWNADATVLTLSPVTPLPYNKGLVLRVNADARTHAGDILGHAAEYDYTVALPTPRIRLVDGRLKIMKASTTPPINYEGMASPDSPISKVDLELYSMPGEQLATLGAQAANWPLPLPPTLLQGLQKADGIHAQTSLGAKIPEVDGRELSGLAAAPIC